MRLSTQLLTVTLLVAAGGCALQPQTDPAAPALANTTRDQIGHLAIRSPHAPQVALTSRLLNKGAAARKTAVSASAEWLGGTFEAAGSAEEGGILVAAFGLLLTPAVAIGGAVYGASAADSESVVAAGNQTIAQALDFAPFHLTQAYQTSFTDIIPVDHEFVAWDVTNARLQQRGFDSVLDIELVRIASQPSDNGYQVWFELVQSVTLTRLDSHQVLASRTYHRDSAGSAAVSAWAEDNGKALLDRLSDTYTQVANEVAREFFLEPAIRVQGLEPVSKGKFRVGSISGTRPMFVWSVLDGKYQTPQTPVEYEIAIQPKGSREPSIHRVTRTRMVPAEPLAKCRTYQWRVGAHYTSFGSQTQSNWSPDYRFKTPCK
jgi:hypothetical protein